MDRVQKYRDLVAKRKSHHFPPGLLNPSEILAGKFDSEHLGPWSLWQGDLHPDVVVVGQDWGDEGYFIRNKGKDDEFEQTCSNLRGMALQAGMDIGTPHTPRAAPLFFTNAVLGIRAAKGKSGTPPAAWVDDSLPFLVDLLQIMKPRAVVSLGAAACRACRLALLGSDRNAVITLGMPMKAMHALTPILIPSKPAWFAHYHCGPLGLVNRSRDMPYEDWKRLGVWLGRVH